MIGDVVEFDTVPMGLGGGHRRPPKAVRPWRIGGTVGGAGPCRMRIVGRHRHFINAFGENLIVEHIENAVARAARAAGVVVGEFTAAPVYPGEGRRAGLELAVEIEGKAGADLTIFRDAFDGALKEQNVDYTTKRTDSLGMVEPTITALPIGAFHHWLAGKGKLGGQHKCPRCANHRDILSEVVAAGRG